MWNGQWFWLQFTGHASTTWHAKARNSASDSLPVSSDSKRPSASLAKSRAAKLFKSIGGRFGPVGPEGTDGTSLVFILIEPSRMFTWPH